MSEGGPVNGLLCVDKPWGWTSHDVVGAVRRHTGQRAVGHAGTLDPLASGVLVLALGAATRVLDAAMDLPKVYVAEIRLGATSATDDAEGPLLTTAPTEGLTEGAVRGALEGFVGQIQQRPPAYAAIKVDGQPIYRAARRGEEVVVAARQVTIYRLEVLRLRLPRLTLGVWCSKGTYIRALARDLGERLGVGAYLAGLLRAAVGPFTMAEALALPRLGAEVAEGRLGDHLRPPETVLAARPVLLARDDVAADLRHGRPVALPGRPPAGASWALGPDGRLLALGAVHAGPLGRAEWRPRRVFSGDSTP